MGGHACVVVLVHCILVPLVQHVCKLRARAKVVADLVGHAGQLERSMTTSKACYSWTQQTNDGGTTVNRCTIA